MKASPGVDFSLAALVGLTLVAEGRSSNAQVAEAVDADFSVGTFTHTREELEGEVRFG